MYTPMWRTYIRAREKVIKTGGDRMDERNIEQMLKRRVEEAVPGAKCLKFVSPGYTGVPDRIILLPGGAVVFAELKKPGEQPRQRQLFVQEQFRKMGFRVAGCVDSPEAVGQVVQLCVMISGMARTRNAGTATRETDPAKRGRGGSGGK